MYIYKTLSNGIRVAAEKTEHLRSVSIGVWIGNGSRNEKREENGISHFIEHMVFKGSSKRSAEEIADAIEGVGGQINAFTAKEYTCFYTKTLDTHAEIAMDVLSDMIFSPTLDNKAMEMEKKVVCEEINMYEDYPEELVYDLYYRTVWGDTPMGRNILGTPQTLAAMTPDIVRGYMRTHYRTDNIVISVSGSFGDDFFELLEKYFGAYSSEKTVTDTEGAKFQKGNIFKYKETEQVQLVVGFDSIDVEDESVYALLVMNNVFGGGMSSRLFRHIREKEGLVYSVSAGHSAYIDTGSYDISAGMNGGNLKRVCSLISEELRILKRDKLTASEVEKSKEMLKGSYILSCESSSARMESAGRSLLVNKPVYSPEEILKKIDAVTADDTAEIIDRIIREETMSAALLGVADERDLSELHL